MYRVIVHRRVSKFLTRLADEKARRRLLDVLASLRDYPVVLRSLDVEKIRGAVRTFRVRVGRYRIVFYVNKAERTIYVTHVFMK